MERCWKHKKLRALGCALFIEVFYLAYGLLIRSVNDLPLSVHLLWWGEDCGDNMAA